MSTGRPLRRIADPLAQGLATFSTRQENARHFLTAIRGILDEEEPAYAT
jgi:hypothetical protein